MGIADTSIQPTDCFFGIGLPLSKEQFFIDKNHSKKDFVKNCCSSWQKYQFEIADNIKENIPVFESWGVNVIKDMTFEQFIHSFEENRYKVVTIFSHWTESRIEFSDGLVHVKEIVEEIPNDFQGVVDLCVCHPKQLADMLRVQRPNCLTRYINKQATPSFWIKFYLTLYALMNEYQLTYFQALENAVKININIARKILHHEEPSTTLQRLSK